MSRRIRLAIRDGRTFRRRSAERRKQLRSRDAQQTCLSQRWLSRGYSPGYSATLSSTRVARSGFRRPISRPKRWANASRVRASFFGTARALFKILLPAFHFSALLSIDLLALRGNVEQKDRHVIATEIADDAVPAALALAATRKRTFRAPPVPSILSPARAFLARYSIGR